MEDFKKPHESGPGRGNAYIELNAFICLNMLAQTGGRAKLLIRSGDVFVNREKETRNKRKLYPGDVVSYGGKDYPVDKEVCRMLQS